MFLSSYAAEVKVLVRGEGLKLSMSQYLIDQIASKANIQVLALPRSFQFPAKIAWNELRFVCKRLMRWRRSLAMKPMPCL